MTVFPARRKPSDEMPGLRRILARALFWIAVAFVAGTAGAFVTAFVWSYLSGAPPRGIPGPDLQAASFMGALLLAALTFDHAARREAGASPDPVIRASIRPAPIRRPYVVALACLALTPFGVFLAAVLVTMSPGFQQTTLATDPLLLVLAWTLAATVTPFAEERFFRGWLWVALALRIGVPGAAVVSGLLFLLAHAAEALLHGQFAGALARGVALVPLAIGLSLVRIACGGPRASMIVHGFYNLAVTAAPSILLASGYVLG